MVFCAGGQERTSECRSLIPFHPGAECRIVSLIECTRPKFIKKVMQKCVLYMVLEYYLVSSIDLASLTTIIAHAK
jgi:hypothetical protein